MAEPVQPSTEPEPADTGGAPVSADAIDPDLIRLSRARLRIGVVTAAGVVFLCVFFLLRLSADRRFSGNGEPTKVTVSDVLAGSIARDAYVSIDAEPIVGNAIRATPAKKNLGMRLTPVRGTGDRLWLVMPGNGWQTASGGSYVGRLRKLGDLPFEGAVTDYLATNPRPVFAPAAAVRAGFASGKVSTLDGETITLADHDRVAFELVDPDAAIVIATINERLPSVAVWTAALATAGITPAAAPTSTDEQIRFEITTPGAVAVLTTKLETASLWAARVEPVTRHYDTTWGALRASPVTGFTVGAITVPDAQLDLVGLYVARGVPGDSYAILVGDRPDDYWFVLPITIALAAIGLLFAWALVRAVRRDILAPRPVA